jgi:signal transduction histidine kinase
MMTRTQRLNLVILAICLCPPLTVFCLPTGQTGNVLEVRSVTVDGNPAQIRQNGSVNLGSSPKNIAFTFGPVPNSKRAPVRIRYRLEGYEDRWHDEASEMDLTVRFYDKAGDITGEKTFGVSGESAGWDGSLVNSTLIHRRESLLVPPRASRVMVVISSAGPPDATGIYVVADLVVSKSSEDSPSVTLLESPLDLESPHSLSNQPPSGWMRDGIHPSMAEIVQIGQSPAVEAFAILDDDPIGHAEWHNVLDDSPKVVPGDHLVVEWNEMYSIGAGSLSVASYDKLVPGKYVFQVEGTDIMGKPTGMEATLMVQVPQPFWRMPWFWGVAGLVLIAAAFGSNRYMLWHRMRREMLHLKNQQALEQERLRIAHDIHDDLGARVTEISLLSAISQNNPIFPDKARIEFDRISQMSRELVSALYQTVWAVNPENDNLDALGNYLCQMVNQMCERVKLRSRFDMVDLPREIPISSQTRHNVTMAIKEAVHNVIKHAEASEICIQMTFKENLLTVTVQDNGCGFQPADKVVGHGLANMKRRMEDIGGSCTIESSLGHGTTAHFSLHIRPSSKIA